MYFVGFDIEFVGLKIALQMQSVFLYLSGFLSVLNWMYERKHELTSDLINEQEEEYMFFNYYQSLLPFCFHCHLPRWELSCGHCLF